MFCHWRQRVNPYWWGGMVQTHLQLVFANGYNVLFLFLYRYKGNLASVFSKSDMDWLWDFGGKKPFWIGVCYFNEINQLLTGFPSKNRNLHFSNQKIIIIIVSQSQELIIFTFFSFPPFRPQWQRRPRVLAVGGRRKRHLRELDQGTVALNRQNVRPGVEEGQVAKKGLQDGPRSRLYMLHRDLNANEGIRSMPCNFRTHVQPQGD